MSRNGSVPVAEITAIGNELERSQLATTSADAIATVAYRLVNFHRNRANTGDAMLYF